MQAKVDEYVLCDRRKYGKGRKLTIDCASEEISSWFKERLAPEHDSKLAESKAILLVRILRVRNGL